MLSHLWHLLHVVADSLVAVTGDLFSQLLLPRSIQSLSRLGQLLPSQLDALDGPVEDELVVGSNTVRNKRKRLLCILRFQNYFLRNLQAS